MVEGQAQELCSGPMMWRVEELCLAGLALLSTCPRSSPPVWPRPTSQRALGLPVPETKVTVLLEGCVLG